MIYLDNAATSFPKPEEVYRAVDHYFRQVGVSFGRGAYRRALEAERLVFETRRALGQLFGIKDIGRIIFTANVTESLNLALKGYLNKGDHVITSHMEHNSMWRPLKLLEKEKKIKITVLDCPQGAPFEPRQLEEAITSRTRLVALNHASNVTGTLMPLKEAGSICQSYQVPLLADTAQTAGAYPINVEELNIALLAFTGHKGLLGPTGTGGLYVAPGIELKPLKEGGTGGDSLLENQPEKLPDRFEAGTLNVAGLAGLKAGVTFIMEKGLENIREEKKRNTELALTEMAKIPGITLYGPSPGKERMAVISFNLKSILSEDIAFILDEAYDIMVRSGLHCSPQAHRCLGTVENGTVRASLGVFNTEKDVVRLKEALEEITRQGDAQERK